MSTKTPTPAEAKGNLKVHERELKVDLKKLRAMLKSDADEDRMAKLSKMAAELSVHALQFYKKSHTPKESRSEVEQLHHKTHKELKRFKAETDKELKQYSHKRQMIGVTTVEELLSADVKQFEANFDPKTHSRSQSLQTVDKFQTNTAKHLSSLNGSKLDAPVKSLLGKISQAITGIVTAAKQWIASAYKMDSGLFKSKQKQVAPDNDLYGYKLLDSPKSKRGF